MCKRFFLQVAALYCVRELAYVGREEVIEGVFKEDLSKKLMGLHRMNWHNDEEREICVSQKIKKN